MSVEPRERLARVALSRIAEPGDPKLCGLVDEMGAITLYDFLSGQRDVEGVLTDLAQRLVDCEPHTELERARRQGIRFVVPGDTEWPSQVGDLHRAGEVQRRGGTPIGLWVRGPVRLDELDESLAIVGARSATTYGVEVAADLAAGAGRHGWCVVSGAAFGIDQAAHRGALGASGRTVAVLACGVDRVYPAAHKNLLDHLAAHGAVVSEAPPGCAPTRLRFLARNRIIAAITRGTVVVEAAVRSGALNTANWAERLNRPLLGVPGSVTSAPSQGVHQLIRTGAATLVTTEAEMMEMVGAAGQHLIEPPRAAARRRDRLDLRHQQVLDAVPVARRARADSIAHAAGVGLVEVRRSLEL
ncbi:DNA-processing protein DprA, partial [Nocardioides sp.]|uniref:DNA-processing protein DprA n=1 Tax=Nocardioides sp. TaxID=35761 RepID=UPI002734190F